MQELDRNTAGQTVLVFAFNASTGAPVTGDAANITTNIALDDGSASALTTNTATETQRGHYRFSLSQAETDAASHVDIYPDSSTSGVEVVVVSGSRIKVRQPSILTADAGIPLGDVEKDAVIQVPFTTLNRFGLPATLSDSPTLSVYRDNVTAPVQTGITISTDHASVTGLNHASIDTSDAAYTPLSDYYVVVAVGSVNGVDWTGRVVAHFSIEKYPVRVSSSQIGQDGEDIASVYNTFAVGIPCTVAASPTSGGDFNLTFTYPPSGGYQDDDLNGRFLVFLDGSMAGLSQVISDFTASTGRVQFTGSRSDGKDDPFPRTPSAGALAIVLGLA